MLSMLLAMLETEEDRERFLKLHGTYEKKLYAVAVRVLGDRTAAEDAVQQTWLQLIRRWDRVSGLAWSETEGYLVTAVKNVAVDMLRKERREEALPEDWDPPAPETGETDYRYLVSLIRALPESYRRVLELKCMEEESNREIARRLTTGRLICIDRDQAAIDAAQDRLAPWLDRVTLIHSNFSELKEVLSRCGVSGADGMLFDLGVSSPQLDDASRGFSYMQDAPLDMRMDTSAPLSAADIVNTWSQEELRRILFEYGEERYAPAIARAIVRARETAPVKTTLELVEIIKSAMPPAALREKQHPAKRSFQAIRIAVNGELDALPPMLRAAVDGLNPGGRLAVITFHSLEDRIVKRTLAELARGCVCPPEFPVCVCGKKPQVRLVTRKPVTAGGAELEENPRARSAKLRVAEKCGFDL